jgi:thymidylate synthase
VDLMTLDEFMDCIVLHDYDPHPSIKMPMSI